MAAHEPDERQRAAVQRGGTPWTGGAAVDLDTVAIGHRDYPAAAR